MKLLIKKKNGSVHIREKSNESGANLKEVHPNKVKSWLALSEASHNAAGRTMEEVIQAVVDEMKGVTFKSGKERTEVSQEEYDSLLIQCTKKGISGAKLDSMVIIKPKDKSIQQLVEEVLQKERMLTL